MASRLAYSLLVAALLFVSAARAEDDYIYDEEAEETASTHVPKFTSQPVSREVKIGDTVTLPCLVDKMGDTVIIWKAGEETLFTGAFPGSQDPRFRLEDKGQLGNNLVIEGVTAKDSQAYQCQITSNPPVNLKHSVMIQIPPSVTVSPKAGVMVVQEGKQVTLECSADGYPKPTVTWTKKGGLLPYGEKKHTGERLDIPAVESGHIGDYSCTVDNGVGQPVVEHIRLEVNFAPRIQVTSDMVHTGAGHEAQIECSIQGQPLPQVMWYRVKGTPLDEAHYQRYQKGYKYGIRIAEVQDSDLGVYSCQAENNLGKHTAIVHLTGKPKPAMILSEPNGNDKNMYKLRWSVESYAEPLEYKIHYRRAQAAGEAEAQWSELVTAHTAGQQDGGVVYQQEVALNALEPAAVYQAMVTARNKYGWSESNQTFKFSTRGANESSADIKGGEALVSKHPSGADMTSRSAAVCLLSTLLALAALL